jgi:hypothetical protein
MRKGLYVRLIPLKPFPKATPFSEMTLFQLPPSAPAYLREGRWIEGRLIADIRPGGRICLWRLARRGSKQFVVSRLSCVVAIHRDIVVTIHALWKVVRIPPPQ